MTWIPNVTYEWDQGWLNSPHLNPISTSQKKGKKKKRRKENQVGGFPFFDSDVLLPPLLRPRFHPSSLSRVAVSQGESTANMHNLHRIISRLSSTSLGQSTRAASLVKEKAPFIFGDYTAISSNIRFNTYRFNGSRAFSVRSGVGGNDGKDDWESAVGGSFGETRSDDLGWDHVSMWSTGLTKEHFDGQAVGHQTSSIDSGVDTANSSLISNLQEIEDKIKELEAENQKSKAFLEGWKEKMQEVSVLLKQVREPGARGSYLKDSEKAEMYRLHRENPEVYTVERLAKDYRIMRQRVHAILWLKELEEEEEKKLGHPLDDSVELLLDTCPEFFNSHDREFHVASLPYKPDFKVMPEGWDGTIRDLDEVHYEISKKEDDLLYEEFVQRMNFNKKKMAGEVKCHKYSRRRPSEGWKITVEKMGQRGKRGNGGGWKFVSLPDGSSRPLDEMEKMYVKRETPRRRRRILP